MMPGVVNLLTPEPAAAPELHKFLCHIQTSWCCFLPKNWFTFGWFSHKLVTVCQALRWTLAYGDFWAALCAEGPFP